MSYRLLPDEPLEQGVRRVAREQIRGAMDDLSNNGSSPAECIHQARKRFKKARGLLRLTRDAMGGVYAEENPSLREAGRALAGLRDAKATIDCFNRIRPKVVPRIGPKAFATVHATLHERLASRARSDHGPEDRVETVLAELRRMDARIDDWGRRRMTAAEIVSGFRRTYRRARKTFRAARKNPTSETFHEWRKRVKSHWYHVRLFQDACPKKMKKRRGRLRTLSELLGDDHDLHLLRRALSDERTGLPSDCVLEDTLVVIDRRQRKIRKKACRMGKKLFRVKPRRFGKDIVRAYAK